MPSFTGGGNAPLHKVALKEEREPSKYCSLALWALQRGDHTATSLPVSEGCSPVLAKSYTVLKVNFSTEVTYTQKKSNNTTKKAAKWTPLARFWSESVWNEITSSPHCEILKAVSVRRAPHVSICSEASVPQLAPFEVKGKAPGVFMVPRFLTGLKKYQSKRLPKLPGALWRSLPSG